jgi:hypothetical protein
VISLKKLHIELHYGTDKPTFSIILGIEICDCYILEGIFAVMMAVSLLTMDNQHWELNFA